MCFRDKWCEGLSVDSSLPPAGLGSPKLAFTTYHQDAIGDDFGYRYLAAKDEGPMGYPAPQSGYYYKNVTKAV